MSFRRPSGSTTRSAASSISGPGHLNTTRCCCTATDSTRSPKEPSGARALADYFSGGDTHYYLPYDGNAPYQKMRTFRSRFMSETGFESFPDMKTIRAFSEPADDMPAEALRHNLTVRSLNDIMIDAAKSAH
jgi:hypothetical protein